MRRGGGLRDALFATQKPYGVKGISPCEPRTLWFLFDHRPVQHCKFFVT